jgi:crossover junction endodeoxyribonuclease RuvC
VILGVDPGLVATGYGLITLQNGGVALVEAGVIRTTAKDPLETRLLTLAEGLDAVLAEFRPDALAVEALFSHYQHPRTAVIMGHARGVILLCAARVKVSVYSYSATRIKKAVVGDGRAPKAQVRAMLQQMLSAPALAEGPDHLSDALAAACCHLGAQGAGV